jgi:hypothetical protein
LYSSKPALTIYYSILQGSGTHHGAVAVSITLTFATAYCG